MAFTPEDASNKRFRVKTNRRSVARISDITENGFTINAIGAGTAAIVVTSINNAKTATIAVTVAQSE